MTTRNHPQARVEIYSKSYCPYCQRALALLDELGVDYEHHEITFDREKQAEMLARATGRTVPQIFIDGEGIGGNDDLQALHASGELVPRLFPGRAAAGAG